MVKILGLNIGEKAKTGEVKVCNHPLFKRGMRLNQEKQQMEIFCKQCGQTVEEGK